MLPIKKAVPTTVTVAQASILLLAANSLRKYADFSNSTANYIWISFGAAAIVGKGSFIPPGGSYVIDRDNLWVGDVFAISSAGNNVIGAQELS